MQLSPLTALLIIDMQQGFDNPYWGRRNNLQLEENCTRLLEAWRAHQRPIYHIQHVSTNPQSPLWPGQTGNDFKDMVRPQAGEPVIQKQVNSAFIGTDLEARLRGAGADTLVIIGLTTDHCVSTTTRMAGNLGFTAYVVADAVATFDRRGHDGTFFTAEEIHATALASLHGEFASVVDTQSILA